MPPIDEYVAARPAPPLRPLVAHYHGYRQVGVAPARHRGLPSPYLTLIVALDDPLEVAAHPDPRQPGGRYDTLIGGLHTTPALLIHHGRQSGIQLALTPLGARTLFGLPAAELAGTDIDATTVLPRLSVLRERLLAATGWRERFAVVDAELLRLVQPADLPGAVTAVWDRLLASRGTVGVAELAGDLGWSSRYLGSRFRTEIGLGIKEAARVVRFDRARRLLQNSTAAGRRPALADLAAGCGYYDQAHLAREFGALAGCAPSHWLATEIQLPPLADPAD